MPTDVRLRTRLVLTAESRSVSVKSLARHQMVRRLCLAPDQPTTVFISCLALRGPGSASPNLKAMFGRRLRAELPFFALGITWPLARPRLVSPSCPEAPMPLPSLNWAMNYAGSIASTTHQQSGFGRALLLPRWTLSKGSRGQWAWAKRRRR